MTDNSQYIEQFNAYLDHKLSEEEHQSFEQKLNTDQEFRAAFEAHKEIRAGLEHHGLQRSMNKWHGEMKNEESTKSAGQKRPLGKYVLIAIGVMALILVLIFLVDKKPTSPAEIYASYYYPDPGLPVTMGSDIQNSFQAGMQQYKQGNYIAALESWQNIPSDLADTEVYYYIGSALLAQDQAEESIEYFNRIDANAPYFEEANWYQLLIALKNGNWREADQLHGILSGIPPTMHLDELKEIGDLVAEKLEEDGQ